MTYPRTSTRRRARWMLPVAIVVGLLFLLVLGLLGWIFLRPLLPGDYSKVQSEGRLLAERHQDEVMFLVVQVIQTESADQETNQVKVDAMMDTVDAYRADIEALTEARAFRDDQVLEAYRPVTDAVGTYRDFLADWGSSVPPVKHMQQVCYEFDRATAFMDADATGERFDAAAADCVAAVEAAKDVKVQDGIVRARADYLAQRRAAWQLNGDARTGSRIDREKNQQAIRAEHESTNAWQQADEEAAAEVLAQLEAGSSDVVTAFAEFDRFLTDHS